MHRAMSRPSHLLGAERELVLMTGLMAAILIVVAADWATALLGAVMWGAVLAVLRYMAKADPIMSKIYLDQLKLQAFYPAQTSALNRE
jgi:type IV secretion system protein VirB3